MARANLDDRASIEAIYSREAFRQDAGVNATGKTPVLHGVRILSEPDEAGSFELVRADQHTGERDPEGDSVFLPPQLAGDTTALPEGGQTEGSVRAAQDAEYARFIDRVIDAARTATFKPPVGRDVRLQGFHGG